MHRADRPLASPALFAGIGGFVPHPQEHLRPDSWRERLAIEAGAYADVEAPDPNDRTDRTPIPSLPRPRPVRGAIRS